MKFYIDESGSHDTSPVLVLAGLVASEKQWARLSTQWTGVLNEYGVSDFHATDCANGGKKFRNISPEDRSRLFVRLTNIIKRRVSYRIWTAVAVDDYRASPYYNQDPKRIYSLASIACVSLGRHIAAQRSGDFRLAYVFDQGSEGNLAFSLFLKMLQTGEADVLRIASVAKEDRRELPPLQAADLFVYEIYRYISDQMKDSGRQMRQSLASLLSIQDGGGYFLGGRKLYELARGFVERAKEDEDWRIPVPIEVDWLDKSQTLKIVRRGVADNPGVL